MRTSKFVKALLVFGFGLGLSTAASAGYLVDCNKLLTECHQGNMASCQKAIIECLA
ncbi:MAG: hypothetical protein MJK04_19095 [Psychrosphaera sp.]|nr:hypothetical protein [Psychrosphaera sp.]